LLTFECIKNLISFFSDICILGITVYTFYLKFFCRKISLVKYTSSYSIFKGISVSLVMENNTLSPICFDKISVICNNEYKITVVQYETPQIIEPFKTFIVRMEPFSYLDLAEQNLVNLDSSHDKYLEINTSKGIIYAKYYKNTNILKHNKQYQDIIPVRKFYNGNIILKDTKYALVFQNNNNTDTIFINNSGYMSREINGFNAISPDILNEKTKVKELFGKYFRQLNIPFDLIDIDFDML